MSSKLFWLGLFGLFFLIAAILYSPSLPGPWQYDDYAQILDEKVLTGRSLSQLLSSTFMFKAHLDGWTGTRDLVRASFLVNWQWWGKEPAGYRWVNLIIHVVNATMVAGLVWLLFEKNQQQDGLDGYRAKMAKNNNHPNHPNNLAILSIFSGLLFLIHPLNSQAVAYVAQRFTSMATMFYLGAIVFWILFLRGARKKIADYCLLIISYLFALLAFNSKEIAITLPVTLALVTLVIAPRTSNATNKPININKYKGHYWAILIFPFFLFSFKIPSQIISSSFSHTGRLDKLAEVAVDSLALKQKAVDLTRHDYFFTQINVVGTYLRLAVLPVKQTLDYDYPITKNFDPKTIVLAIFHLGLIGTGGWLLLGPRDKGQGTRVKPSALSPQPLAFSLRLVGLGILWFYLTLLPESSVIPIADLIYEHRAYLPMVGLVIGFSGLAGIYATYKSYMTYKAYIIAAAILWILLLSGATLRRAWVWGNEVRLWADVYEKAPNKPRANKNYGVVLAASGKYEEGVKRLAKAVELEQENADYWSNFGTAYLRWGKYEEASGKFLKAYELFSSQKGLDSLSDLSKLNILSEKDRRQAAQYMNDYGVAMVQSQHADEALAGFEKALKIDQALYAAWLGLGASYNLKEDSEMSIKIFSQAVADFPDQPDGYNNLAIVLKKAGRIEEATAVLARMPKNKL